MRVPGFGQTYPIEFLDNNKLAGEKNTSELVDWGFEDPATFSCFSLPNDTEMLKYLMKAMTPRNLLYRSVLNSYMMS